MKKKLFSLILSVLLIAVFASCTASQETSDGVSTLSKSIFGITPAEHYQSSIQYLAKIGTPFFSQSSMKTMKTYKVSYENFYAVGEGVLLSDILKGQHKLDINFECNYDGETTETQCFGFTADKNSLFLSADGISSLPLKQTINIGVGGELEAFQALYSVATLAQSAFASNIDEYYSVYESYENNSNVGILHIDEKDLSNYDQTDAICEEYGIDKQNMHLNYYAEFATPDDHIAVSSVKYFEISLYAKCNVNGSNYEFSINYNSHSLIASIKVFGESDEKTIAEYSLSAHRAHGTLILKNSDLSKTINNLSEIRIHFQYEKTQDPEFTEYDLICHITYNNPYDTLITDTFNLSFLQSESENCITVWNDFYTITISESDETVSDNEIIIPSEFTSDEKQFKKMLESRIPEILKCFEYHFLESDQINNFMESFEIYDGYGTYIILPHGKNGYYTTTFEMVTDGIKFEDGRILPFTYESLEYSGEDGEHIAEINGHKFVLNEYTDYEGTLCQSLECIDEIEGFCSTASVTYYPELEFGHISIGFTYENNENDYVFTFLDGHTEEKTILFDEEKSWYYFKTE